jgi:integrase
MQKTARKPKAKPEKKPARQRFPGGVSMSMSGPTRYPWAVRYPGEGGKRLVRWFTDETSALAHAKEKSGEAGELGSAFGSVSEAERAALAQWRKFVAKADPKPPALAEVLKEWAARWEAAQGSLSVRTAADKFAAVKKAEGLRPVSVRSLEMRCKRFADAFGERPIASITAPEISDWLLGLEVGLQTKRGLRLALSGLFNFAKARGWLRENPVTDAARPRPPKPRPEILCPGDVCRLFGALEKAAPALIPFWAVRFFGGIREQEALRMDWRMIDLAGGEIHLPDAVAKNHRARTVKIEPALAAFLAPHAQAAGPIVTASDMSRRYHLAKALRILQAEDAEAAAEAKKARKPAPRAFPVPMPANCARHSFATFHLEHGRHAGETALQLGHGGSPELLHRHYRGLASKADAKAFWAIRPAGGAPNVIPFKPAVEWPAPDELQKLLWKKPAVEIARMLGVSDKAVEKHAKRHGLTKPPRGHWQKQASAR